jgi:hypothetical protein
VSRNACSFSTALRAAAKARGQVCFAVGYTGGAPEVNEISGLMDRASATVLFNLALLLKGGKSPDEAWAELKTFIKPEAFAPPPAATARPDGPEEGR